MDFDEQDHEVISLLSKLKESDGDYPVEMMASRRQNFAKQIAALGIGTGAALLTKEGAKAAGGSSIPPIAITIMETALIVAIVAESTFVAFLNRDKVLDLFRTIAGQPTAVQMTAAPNLSLPLPDATEVSYTAIIESAAPTVVTETPTVVGTPWPGMLVVTAAAEAEETSDNSLQANSTPEPNTNNTNNTSNGNNGNHYGQTPVAERTKDSNGGGGGSDQNDENNDNNNDNRDNGNRRGH